MSKPQFIIAYDTFDADMYSYILAYEYKGRLMDFKAKRKRISNKSDSDAFKTEIATMAVKYNALVLGGI